MCLYLGVKPCGRLCNHTISRPHLSVCCLRSNKWPVISFSQSDPSQPELHLWAQTIAPTPEIQVLGQHVELNCVPCSSVNYGAHCPARCISYGERFWEAVAGYGSVRALGRSRNCCQFAGLRNLSKVSQCRANVVLSVKNSGWMAASNVHARQIMFFFPGG